MVRRTTTASTAATATTTETAKNIFSVSVQRIYRTQGSTAQNENANIYAKCLRKNKPTQQKHEMYLNFCTKNANLNEICKQQGKMKEK